MLPVVPLVLLVLLGGGLASLGYGLYERSSKEPSMPKNPAPLPGGYTPPPQPGPDGLMHGTPTELAAAAQFLILNGKDPAAMEKMAAVLEGYGYTDLAQQLRARAAQLRTPAPPGPSPLPPPPPPPSPQDLFPPPAPGGFTAAMLPSGIPALKQGSRGEDVKKWQLFLLSRGAPIGAADGIFGTNTAAGTIAFQRISNITADGIVGPQTIAAARAALGSLPNVLPPSPTPSGVVTATVTGTGVRLRSAPGTTTSQVGTLNSPEIVTVLNWNAGSASGYEWAQVKNKLGVVGYAAKNYLSLNAPAPMVSGNGSEMFVVGTNGDATIRQARCVAPSGCRLRNAPKPTSPFKTLVGNGEQVTILKQLAGTKAERMSPGPGGWTLVRYGKDTGWLPTEWLV